MNFKLIEVEINEKDFPDQKEFAIYITKNEMLKIKEKKEDIDKLYAIIEMLTSTCCYYHSLQEEEIFEILEILNINTGNQGIYFFNLKDTKTNEYKLAIKLRSEEHTSELQSRGHLVCGLLL